MTINIIFNRIQFHKYLKYYNFNGGAVVSAVSLMATRVWQDDTMKRYPLLVVWFGTGNSHKGLVFIFYFTYLLFIFKYNSLIVKS